MDMTGLSQVPSLFLIPLLIWSGVWKALALWRAARSNAVAWYVVLCVINTAGLLEILYLFVFSRPQAAPAASPPPAP